MPADFAWPRWKDKPQSFLAQIDLAEIHRCLPSFLPSSGYLYFFYDQAQSVWGFAPEDLGGWRVLYCPPDHPSLVEHAAPAGLAAGEVYHAKPVAPHRIDVLPAEPPDSLTDQEFETFLELEATPFTGLLRHQMLGYPSPVQGNDMELECQLAANGIDVGTPAGYADPRVAGLKPGAAEWRLLLQLETDDDTGWMWGDAGTLYFWIRESDARRCDFSKVWMIFQCS